HGSGTSSARSTASGSAAARWIQPDAEPMLSRRPLPRHALARLAVALLVVALTATSGRADRVVAVAPLSTLGTEDTSTSTRQLTAEIEAAVTTLGAKLVSARQVAEAIRRARKPQLKACEG